MARIVVLYIALLVSSFQFRDSILDAARRNGGTAVVNIDLLSPVGELSYVTAESGVIVRGILESSSWNCISTFRNKRLAPVGPSSPRSISVGGGRYQRPAIADGRSPLNSSQKPIVSSKRMIAPP